MENHCISANDHLMICPFSGQIDFYNICRGFCLLAVTKAAIRAKLFFNIIDTDGSGTISESEFEVFLKCVNAIDESNYTPEEIKVRIGESIPLHYRKTDLGA